MRGRLQGGEAFVDQVVADVRRAIPGAFLRRAGLGQPEGGFRHFKFRESAVLGHGLDGMAIAVPRRKIHPEIDSAGIGPQDLFDLAEVLHEIPPVIGSEKTQAGDGMADGNLVGRLAMALEEHEPLDRRGLAPRVGGRASSSPAVPRILAGTGAC